MKKILSLILSGLIIVGLTACTGGKQQTETEAATDSTAVAEQTTVAEQNTETEKPEVKEPEVQEPAKPVLNKALFGEWYVEIDDTSISMELNEKQDTYQGQKGYGSLSAYIQYEPSFTLVFTSLTPDGDNIKVHYDKMDQYFNGDPDDYDSPCELVTEKVGSGDLTLIPQGKKVKIDSKELLIKNKVLSKTK